FFFFFFQAEDGIRDFHVTGVQTCALPISMNGRIMSTLNTMARMVSGNVKLNASLDSCAVNGPRSRNTAKTIAEGTQPKIAPKWRSEERRVGKEGRGRRGTDDRRKEEKTDE